MTGESVATCPGDRRVSVTARSAMVFVFAVFAGCVGAGSDGRLAATQRAMDRSPALKKGFVWVLSKLFTLAQIQALRGTSSGVPKMLQNALGVTSEPSGSMRVWWNW